MQVSRCCCLDQPAPPELEVITPFARILLRENPDVVDEWGTLNATGEGPESGWAAYSLDLRLSRHRSVFSFFTTFTGPITNATLRFWYRSVQAPAAPPGYVQNFTGGIKIYYDALGAGSTIDGQALEDALFHPGAQAWSASAADPDWTIEIVLDITTSFNALLADANYDPNDPLKNAFYIVHDWDFPNFGVSFTEATATIPTNQLGVQPTRPIIEVQP